MELLLKLRKSYPEQYAKIKKAYEFAYEAHKGQKRSSGEDYFIHPCAVAEILCDYGFDSSSVIAAFLHDVLEDTEVTAEQLSAEFGDEILELVEGVTKLDKIQFNNKEEAQAENFRKLFMALAKDLRVIIIKLADRLHNMRSLEFVPPEKQKYKSRETLDIYAPLAGRLGISFFKCELEDIAMKYLYPEEYAYIDSKITAKHAERQGFLNQICAEIKEKMDELGIKGEINGRPKHYYSIYKKMKYNGIDIDQVYDLLAVRIIVDDIKDCYTMLGEVHTLWKPLPGRFKDYIAMPKANNYQSLHTTVVTQFNETFEIQIRTVEMHKIAEYGVAAHWQYKEGRTESNTDLDDKVRWIREVMDAEKDINGAREFMDAIKINVFDDEVFVFTPKGDVYDLPVNSTPVDLAYKIHSEVGNHCVGAKINKKMVTLSTKLKTGDIVELLTQANGKPNLDWLKFVRTAGARSRIRAFLKKEQKDENVKRGKDMLEKEARRKGYALSELLSVNAFESILQRLSLNNEEDMYANVGFGGLGTAQVLSKLIEAFRKEHPISLIEVPVSSEKKMTAHSKSGVLVDGDANFQVHMAHCCSPVPGDEIVGYISRGRGVSIHRKDCPNVANLGEERLIAASWDTNGAEEYSATFKVVSEDIPGLLAQMTAYIATAKMTITGANIKTDNTRGTAETVMSVLIKRAEDLDDVIKKISSLKGVIEVRR